MLEPITAVQRRTHIFSNGRYSGAAILRNPRLPGPHQEELAESDIEQLIETNILNSNKYKEQKAKSLAQGARAFINSLSEDNRRKFLSVVRAFARDKEKGNLKYFTGTIWAGGGMRVIAGSSANAALTALSNIVGMNLDTSYACSAGSIQGISNLLECTSPQIINSAIEAPFDTFPNNRQNLEDWINGLMTKAFRAITHKKIKTLKFKHLKEHKVNFDVLVAELSERIPFPVSYFAPDVHNFFAEYEKRYGIPADEIPIAKAIGSTTYFPGMFFNPLSKDFGGHFIEDKGGNKHYAFDPGLFSKNRIPIHMVKGEIALDAIRPNIYFVTDYTPGSRQEMQKLKDIGGIETGLNSNTNVDRLANTVIHTTDVIDNLFFEQPEEKLKELGLQRTFFTAPVSNINPHTKEIACISTGGLASTPEDVRETVIMGGIPTIEFKDTENSIIDQLYNAFVDPRLSPYELILRDRQHARETSKQIAQKLNHYYGNFAAQLVI